MFSKQRFLLELKIGGLTLLFSYSCMRVLKKAYLKKTKNAS